MQVDNNLLGILQEMKLFNTNVTTKIQQRGELDITMDKDYGLGNDNEVGGLQGDSDLTTAPPKPQAVRTVHPRLQKLFEELRQKCHIQHARTPPLQTDGPYCNRTIDRFGGCWPDALPGSQAEIQCPELSLGNHKAFAFRECTMNGTWQERNGFVWGNYTQCFTANDDEISSNTKYIYIFIGGFSLSLIMLLISLFIFFWFRQLRCDRITIHKNLFLSYVLTGTAWILYYILVALDGDTQLHNPVWCQILHVLCQYFVVCNFLWMFCEGLYLNTIMVYAFTTGKTLIISCYVIGWGLPCILTVVYALIRVHDDNFNYDCWITDTSLLWIMYGPIVISIAINVLFLINIVRLLITKLRQMPEADQTKKATRATLILVPLLGLQYLLFPIKPEEGSKLDEAYHVAVALLVSLQGAFISAMYCFCNGEVIQVVKRKWNQHRIMRNTARASSTHGTTYTTMEPVTQTNTTYYSTACNKDPPLEMSKIEDENR